MQLLFVSVVSKVISDGIFNEPFNNKKRWQNKLKTLKNVKRALNKKRKKTFFYMAEFEVRFTFVIMYPLVVI